MKLKKVLIILIVALGCVVAYNSINKKNSTSNLEKNLTLNVPEEFISCYYVDVSGQEIFNTLEIKKLIIDRQMTEGNLKFVECTVEMESDYLKKVAFLNFSLLKYDEVNWQVESCSEISDPKVIPKTQPDESYFIKYIKKYEGFKSLAKTNEYIDMENGEIVYFYEVLDSYDYIAFEGDGVSCSAIFQKSTTNYNIDRYCWNINTENNTEITWNVLGTWHIEGSVSGNPPYRTADITVNSLSDECGEAMYSYPCYDGYDFTGEYDTSYGVAHCSFSGSNPLDAKCVLSGLRDSMVIITCDGAEGSVGGRYYSSTLTKY